MPKKQTEIEGTERYYNEEISAAIETHKAAKTKRTEAKAELDAASEHIQSLMREHDITEYVDPELEAKVTLSEKTRLSVTKFETKETSYDNDETAEAAE